MQPSSSNAIMSTMCQRPVALLDSGMGGLPYLAWIQEHLPRESLVYLADRKNFPYGEKTPEQITSSVLDASLLLREKFNIKVLVLACNTASVTALDTLRKKLDVPVVGVVPAVKTAFERSRAGRVGVLATQRTIDDPYLQGLINRFGDPGSVTCLAAPDIVRYVEEDYEGKDTTRRKQVLEPWSRSLKEAGVDALVLGCTHFLHVDAALQELLGTDIQVVDSRDGVGRRLKWVLEQKNLLAQKRLKNDQLFITYGPNSLESLEDLLEKYKKLSHTYLLDFGGVLS